MLAIGLGDWGGPAYGSQPLAHAMGFESLEHRQRHEPLLAHGVAALKSTPGAERACSERRHLEPHHLWR